MDSNVVLLTVHPFLTPVGNDQGTSQTFVISDKSGYPIALTPHLYPIALTPHHYPIAIIPHHYPIALTPHHYPIALTPHHYPIALTPGANSKFILIL